MTLASAHHRVDLGLTWWCLTGAVVLYLVLPAAALAALGVPYDVPNGSFPAKIHPGSYLMMFALLVAWQQAGFRADALWQSAREQPLLVAYLACMLTCFSWAVARHGPSGLAFYIDTLIMPGVASLLLMRQPETARLMVLQVIMGCILLSAVLALAEYALKVHVVPGVLGTVDDEPDAFFRSAALLGHPLTGAKVTVTSLPFITRLPWSWRWRVAAAALLSLALLSYGGRTSLVMGVLVYGSVALWVLGHRVLAGRLSYLQLTGGSVGALLGLGLLGAAVMSSGLGERIFNNLSWDNSADVRFLAWRTLDHFHDLDLWLGLPISGIDHLAERVGIDMRFEAIENFWVYQLLLLGVVGFVPFALGLMLLWVHLLLRAGPVLWLSVPVYIVVASGTNSLASKSISLLILSTLVHASTQSIKNRPTSPRAMLATAGGAY